jgi:hypothetical protein
LPHRPPLRRQDREASFKVSAAALVLNGRTLPWQAPGGALGMVSLGSRIADQQVNGSVEWLNGANFHVERSVGPGRPSSASLSTKAAPSGPAARRPDGAAARAVSLCGADYMLDTPWRPGRP